MLPPLRNRRFQRVLRGRFSAAARDYFARLDAAGLRVTTYDAANARLIDRLVANGGNFWPDSGAFNAMAGYLFPSGGTLIPLKDGHDAGTLNAFVTGDWNAVTGLKGDGSTKEIESNRAGNADGQNNHSFGVYLSELSTIPSVYIGNRDISVVDGYKVISRGTTSTFYRSSTNAEDFTSGLFGGYLGVSRNLGTGFNYRLNGVTGSQNRNSETPSALPMKIYNRTNTDAHSNMRCPFYHIGPNLNGAGELAELESILTDWQTDLANA